MWWGRRQTRTREEEDGLEAHVESEGSGDLDRSPLSLYTGGTGVLSRSESFVIFAPSTKLISLIVWDMDPKRCNCDDCKGQSSKNSAPSHITPP